MHTHSRMHLRHSEDTIWHSDLLCESSDMLQLAGEDMHSSSRGVAGDQGLRQEQGDEPQTNHAHKKLE